MMSQPTTAITDKPSEYDLLNRLGCLFERTAELQGVLQQAVEMIVDATRVTQGALYWPNGETVTLRAHAGRKSPENGEVLPLPPLHFVDGTLKSDEHADMIVSKLMIAGDVVGYLQLPARNVDGAALNDADLRVVNLITQQVGYAIEMQKVRQLLASKYARFVMNQNSLSAASPDDALTSTVLEAVKRPERVARIIAGSFYKDLRKAGFETKQILMVASEIIESLNSSLRKASEKREG